MPIKLPKGFTRRKSSGNVLDEVEQAPGSSFKVFERPDGLNKGRALTSVDGRFYRSENKESDNIFAGIERPVPHNRASGGTNNSTSTTGLYDSSSSARYSSSSTLPSSTDGAIHNDLSRGVHDLPVPPVPDSPSIFSLRAAGRTFSFGSRPQRASVAFTQQPQQPQRPPPVPPVPQHQTAVTPPSTARDRAMTASSASTAIPPKLLESDLSGDDGFGNMFENLGKRKSAAFLPDSSRSDDIKQKGRPTPAEDERDATTPAPIIVDRWQPVEPSPASWDSQVSSHALINKKDDNHAHGGQTRLAPSHSISSAKSSASDSSEASRSFIVDNDDDAEIIRKSILLSNRDSQLPTNLHQNPDEDTPLFENDEITTGARLASEYEDRIASTPNQNKVMTPAQFERYRQQREMTRQLSIVSKSDTSEVADNYEDEEDEDEAERSREAVRQRRKQEAHLSVYRQQMMKVIGQDVPAPSSGSETIRPVSERGSMSTPNLLSSSSTFGLTSFDLPSFGLPSAPPEGGKNSDGDEAPNGTNSANGINGTTNIANAANGTNGSINGVNGANIGDGEDDDDVPLGILAAHGFPNKNRPPTRLSMSNSNPNLRLSHYASAPPGADIGAGGNLPVFARNLPRDPYFGASIVNAPNRESLALAGGIPALGPSQSSSSLPPGGLVGVIANEERARAIRRGSPNTQGVGAGIPRLFSAVNMAQMNTAPGPWTGPGAVPQYQQPQAMSAGEQAQLHISQQMTEIMQVQVQMMQQMMQMQNAAPGQQPLPQMNPNFLSAMGQPPVPGARPISTGSSLHLPANFNPPPQMDQRTLSMLDPSMSRWNLNRPPSIHPDMMGRPMTSQGPQGPQGYTPSIAPSERSNVGMAARYRPVSMAGQDQQMPRSSTFTSSVKPWNNELQRPSSVAPGNSQPANRKSSLLANMTIRPVGTSGKQNAKNNVPDEDDDEGWADMVKTREKKKSSWKLKKESSALGDILHMVH